MKNISKLLRMFVLVTLVALTFSSFAFASDMENEFDGTITYSCGCSEQKGLEKREDLQKNNKSR